MPSLRDELDHLHAEKKKIETRIAEIYKISQSAPVSEKVCDDSLASMLDDGPEGGIEYPIAVHGITYQDVEVLEQDPSPRRRNSNYGADIGGFVAVRPCGEEYGGHTYLGIYLGKMATSAGAFYHKDTGTLEVTLWMHNPAMWVPDLKRVIFGMGSWWSAINSPEDLRQITNADIEDVWYVRALKEVTSRANADPNS